MAKKIRVGTLLRHNYREMLFVAAAFTLMVLAAYFFIGRILRGRLLDRAEEVMYTAAANVRASLSEAEATLLTSYHVVQDMLERNAPAEDIFDYLLGTTEWMRQRDQGLLVFYGIYGYINGEFFDSMGLNPNDSFVPQTSPWYQAAVRSGNTVAYTAPYIDWRTGDPIVSAVHNIDLADGDIAGILVVDFNINRLAEYIGSLTLAARGYGMLINQNMTLIAHPDSIFAGHQLQDLGGSYSEIARILRSGEDVFARRITDTDGFSVIVFFNRIFNGWYVGIVTHYYEFYRDLNVAAAILVFLGIVLSLLLCFILLRISHAKMRADQDNLAKSSFLASMSHEIRTPMNAITGMAELLLRGDLPDEARGYAQDIQHAGNNLISIINDILDFSKIEAGKLDITPAKYLLSSLVNDTVNIVRMRLAEKPVRFYTNVDGNIPNSLIGDELRLRQILLNLLSNAVKYTDKGYIGLSFSEGKRENGQVWLKVTVTDTGKGIKPEDQKKLFHDFVQLDETKNRGIEGTGLGLAITRRLCFIMGGDITMESEYGKGSAFTVVIPQGIESDAPFAVVEKAIEKKVVVYERRSVCAQSVCWALENLGVPHILARTPDDFASVLRGEYFFVFCGYGLYEEIRPIMEQGEAFFPGGKKPQLALMVEWSTEVSVSNARFLYLPIQSLSIANVLNGRTDSKGYESSGTAAVTRFTIPEARILVVDDIATNLKVAEGLLAPYGAVVDTCLSGTEAIELVQRHNYDLVFMDHMMPGMDGIEAAAIIRAWEKGCGEKNAEFPQETPIIALTANAVLGMREMFFENGFNDFLAKPIEVAKLDEILAHWIPKEKRKQKTGSDEQGSEANHVGIAPGQQEPALLPDNSSLAIPPAIPGLDMQRGIAMTGGTVALYRQVLTMFRRDVQERLPFLTMAPDEKTLSMLVTQIHALKSASASIGAEEISTQAAALEAAGKGGDMAFIQKQLPAFTGRLAELAEGIRVWEAAGRNGYSKNEKTQGGESGFEAALPFLQELAAALQSENAAEIDRILEQLEKQTPDAARNSGMNEALEQISDEVLMAEYSKAGEILEKFLASTN